MVFIHTTWNQALQVNPDGTTEVTASRPVTINTDRVLYLTEDEYGQTIVVYDTLNEQPVSMSRAHFAALECAPVTDAR